MIRGIRRGQNINKEIFSSASNCINGNANNLDFATLEEKIDKLEKKMTMLFDDKMNEIRLAIREIVLGSM